MKHRLIYCVNTYHAVPAVVTGFSDCQDNVHLPVIAGLWECYLVAKLSMQK